MYIKKLKKRSINSFDKLAKLIKPNEKFPSKYYYCLNVHDKV